MNDNARVIYETLKQEGYHYHAPSLLALDTLVADLERAQAALAEIEAKPYRAEEVTARYRRETR